MILPVFQVPWRCWTCDQDMIATYPPDENILTTEFRGNLAWTYSKTLEADVIGNLCPACGAHPRDFS